MSDNKIESLAADVLETASKFAHLLRPLMDEMYAEMGQTEARDQAIVMVSRAVAADTIEKRAMLGMAAVLMIEKIKTEVAG